MLLRFSFNAFIDCNMCGPVTLQIYHTLMKMFAQQLYSTTTELGVLSCILGLTVPALNNDESQTQKT